MRVDTQRQLFGDKDYTVRRKIAHITGKIVPSWAKDVLFRASLSAMSASHKDDICVRYEMASVEVSLRRLRALGFRPANIVDVGAFQGTWTQMVKGIFPDAAVLMIEAQPAKEQILETVSAQYNGEVDYKISLLGPEARDDVPFFELQTGSSILPEQSSIQREVKRYAMRTLDEIVAERIPSKVDFLKLDVQGYELEILRGSQNTLQGVEVILMEVALLEVNRGAPLVDEVLNFMKQRGFVVYDICSFIRRPLDDALWQSDFLFVHEGSSFRQKKTFD